MNDLQKMAFDEDTEFDFNLLKPQFAHKDVEVILESDDDE